MYLKIVILLIIGLISGCTVKTSEELYADGVRLLREGNSNGAIVLFRNALEKNQNYLDARYQLARAYVSARKYELAEKEFQKVKRLNPNRQEINLDLAQLYNCQGKADQAIRLAEEYLSENADSQGALEVIGSAYAIKKMPQEAETYFLRAIGKEPGNPSPKLELALLYSGQGRTEDARLLLGEVIRISPTNIRAICLLADTDVMLGRNADALARYKKLEEINPADPVAPYKIGLLHVKLEHFAIAETIAGELIEKFPASAEGYRLKGIVSYRKKDFMEAISSLQHANKIYPSVVGHYFLGLSLYGNGDLESALSQFRQILDRAPTFHQARLLTGIILLQQKRVDDAITELSKLVAIDARNPFGHSMLGNAYMAKGLFEEGMKELDIALEIEPKLIDAYLKKGILHLRQGKTDEVEADLKTAISIAPEILNTRLLLSSFYERQNNRTKALATLSEGVSGNKNDVILYCGMARIMFADNRSAEAIRCLNKAQECNPDAVSPYFLLAGYFADIRDTGKAMQEYAEVLKKEPGNVKAMLQTAALLVSSGRDGEALEWYLKATGTRDSAAYLALARYYEQKPDIEKSLAVLDEAGRYIPRSADLLEQRARLHLKRGHYNEALRVCNDIESLSPERAAFSRVAVYTAMKKLPEAVKEAERIIAFKPDSSDGYMLLAAVCQELNNPRLAIEALKKGIRRAGTNPQTSLALALLYAKAGNTSLALKTCDEILRKRPRYAPAYFIQGTILEAQGNKREAVRKYRAALAHSGNYAAALNNLAYLYLDGYGTREEALRMAERAIALEPENPRYLDTLGYAHLKNNNHQEAHRYLEMALKYLPGDPTITDHLAHLHRVSGKEKPAGDLLAELN